MFYQFLPVFSYFFIIFLHFRHIIMICLKTHYVFCIIFSFICLILYFYLAITTTILSYIYKFSTFPKVKRFVFTKKERPPRTVSKLCSILSGQSFLRINIKIQRSLSRPVLHPFLCAASYPDNHLRL